MAEKNWVDLEAFIDAFTERLKLHATKIGTVDRAKLAASIAKARRDRRVAES